MNFEPANLDSLSSADLRRLYTTFRQLAYYCEAKADAQDARLNGRIMQAQSLEQTCESIYKALPTWARW